MRVLFQVSALALRQVLGPGSDSALMAVGSRFQDRSARLLETLKGANAQAWRAIEIALAGASWWDKCKLAVSSGEQAAFRTQVAAFLQATPCDDLPDAGPEFRKRCLAELKAARKARLLPGDQLGDPAALDAAAKSLARFDDPKAVLDAELAAVRRTSQELQQAGFAELGRFVALKPPQGQPLLVVAVQYFFRKDVQADTELAAEFQFQEVEKLSQRQEAGFAGLQQAVAAQGARLDQLLADAMTLLEDTHALAAETRDVGLAVQTDVQALKAEMAQQNEQLRQMYQAMLDLMARQAAPAPVAAAAPVTAPPEPSEAVVAEMRTLVDECATMPAEEKRRHKALFRAVGRMKAAVRTHDAKRQMRKGVLPSALFTGSPPPPAPVVKPAAPPPSGESVFGALPKSRRLRPPQK
ncbi:hypothetical protein [Urbifossiella limnaea]|uniref:Uncharacterized protein n=1 Tax=Urbifossiella limnaea TaxID=2528023 RepID=A0A517Y2M0_9BACT|nr:hypothetical protein [Urbifossiella limnaea]QDU23979.1 hypothetical protein ETAA1_59900 [Urbifossiella limnaea]